MLIRVLDDSVCSFVVLFVAKFNGASLTQTLHRPVPPAVRWDLTALERVKKVSSDFAAASIQVQQCLFAAGVG